MKRAPLDSERRKSRRSRWQIEEAYQNGTPWMIAETLQLFQE
jgi:hypothetical protein